MFISGAVFAVGLAVLIGGAHFLVTGATSLARRMSVPEIVIGLTVVAFGTSTPELVVNIYSSLGGYHDVVFGNVIGSNIFNILVILGISGLIFPLSVQRNTVWKEIPFSLLAVLLLFVLVNDRLIFGSSTSILSGVDGSLLLAVFVVFILYVFLITRVKTTDTFAVRMYPLSKTVLLVLVGFAALFVGGKLVVESTMLIARQLDVSEKLITLTIVAWGTSLPELATSAVAAYKKRCDIAVGNIIGSNIFNVYCILGVGAVIRGSRYDPVLDVDLAVLIFVTLLLFFTMFTGKKRRLDRWESLLFVIGYGAYMIFLLHRK